jgi:hypothetical protein
MTNTRSLRRFLILAAVLATAVLADGIVLAVTGGLSSDATPVFPVLGGSFAKTRNSGTSLIIIGVRPHVSDSALATSRANANVPVVIDSAKLDPKGVTPNTWTNTGNRGCTQYINSNVAKPAATMARLARRNSRPPREITRHPATRRHRSTSSSRSRRTHPDQQATVTLSRVVQRSSQLIL